MTEQLKTETYTQPIPMKNSDNAAYWDAADQHMLTLQKCTDCGKYAQPPGPACCHCGSQNVTWEEQGTDIVGEIYSYVISYRPFLPGYTMEDMPLVIAVVKLEKQNITIIGNVLHCKPDDVAIGKMVKMIWVDMNEERAIPQWELV
ncbi:Zn-ribbon domain-containing OB-fold protein [Kurthia sibirica]|uniref:DNA-binding protein n=1 Tax=Kurthia sibirica TaxID=202750 RepID=A0A2U3ALH0_9BACL|nr:OB-fold domain-containing protein [Kurthia sibirica]PWI25385.1 hypothetical protein DEX24_08585 [Kurthia sibirica]GEK34598.1 hypothetical protein KSI01_21310 [Kurthia sibirica]